MPIYDFHAHIYPAKIAEKATAGVGNFYNIKMHETGTPERLLTLGDEAGIDYFIVHSVATDARQVEHVNDFIAAEVKEHPDRFVGFGTMHADYDGKCDEVERMIKSGLSGVKIHPDSQLFYVDDPRMYELYECIEGRLPILVHCGDYRYDFDSPERVRKVLLRFPNLTFIAAHFGGWSVQDLATEYLLDTGCYLDCSSSMMYLGKRRSAELIRMYGAERFLFGSDFPMWSPISELQTLKSLGLSDRELSLMLTDNPEKILKRKG